MDDDHDNPYGYHTKHIKGIFNMTETPNSYNPTRVWHGALMMSTGAPYGLKNHTGV